MRSVNKQAPFFGPQFPIYPQVDQLVRIDGPAVATDIYPGFIQQYKDGVPRDREECYVHEPNGDELFDGRYYLARLVGSHEDLPLLATACCGPGSGAECDEASTDEDDLAPGCDGATLWLYQRTITTHVSFTYCQVWTTYTAWEQLQDLCTPCDCESLPPEGEDDFFWCVYSDGVTYCVKSKTEPANTVGGPFTSPADCASQCGDVAEVWWCVSNGGNPICQLSATEPAGVISGPYGSALLCAAACALTNNCCPAAPPAANLYATFSGALAGIGTLTLAYAIGTPPTWSGSTSSPCGSKTFILSCPGTTYTFSGTSTDPWTGYVVSCDPFIWIGDTTDATVCSGPSSVIITETPP